MVKAHEKYSDLAMVKEQGIYVHDNRTGVWRTYETYRVAEPFEWKLTSEVNYDNDRKNGWERHYLGDSLQYLHEQILYINGVANGPVYRYDREGDTTLIGSYKDGLKHGLFKFRRDTIDFLNFDRLYNHGIEGETIYYHPNGKVSFQGVLVDFQPHGLCKTFDETGELIGEQMYEYGMLNGQSKYFEGGKLTTICQNRNNKLNGIYQYYHDNGQLWIEIDFKDDKPWNIIANYDKTGKRKSKGSLRKGNGTVKRYSADGDLIAVEYFKNGEEIKSIPKTK